MMKSSTASSSTLSSTSSSSNDRKIFIICRDKESDEFKHREAEDGERLKLNELFYARYADLERLNSLSKQELERLIVASRSSEVLPTDLTKWRYNNYEKLKRVNDRLSEMLRSCSRVATIVMSSDDEGFNYRISLTRDRVLYGEELTKYCIIDGERMIRELAEHEQPLFVYEDESFELLEDDKRSVLSISCDGQSTIFSYYDSVIDNSLLN